MRRLPPMTWAGLILRNLLRRKVRTALTVAGVAIGVGLIVALLSITNGVKRTAGELVGDGAARIYRLRVGGFVDAGKRRFRIAGMFHSGNAFVDRGVVLPLRV